MAVEVITDGDTGTPASIHVPATTITFVPTIETIVVTSGSELGVDGNAVALKTDIDGSLAGYTAQAGSGNDGSSGTCSYDTTSLSVTESTVLKKGGTFVVLKATITFDMLVDATWIIPPSTPSTIYVTGYAINCNMPWTTVQSKLRA